MMMLITNPWLIEIMGTISKNLFLVVWLIFVLLYGKKIMDWLGL